MWQSLFPNGSLIEVCGKFSSHVMDFSVKKEIEVLSKRSQQLGNGLELPSSASKLILFGDVKGMTL